MAATHHLDFDFTPTELEVAQILLQLPLLFQDSAFPLRLSKTWSIRRKRSALESPPSPSNLKELSPNTPLSLNSLPLSRSESDENVKRSKNKSSLKKKSQYVEAIDELMKEKQFLQGDVVAMEQRYNHLKIINSELKSKMQQMILGSKDESETPEIDTSDSATKTVKFTVKSPSSTLENHNYTHLHLQFPPSIKNQTVVPTAADPTAEQSQNSQIPNHPFYDHSSMGPTGIPDLNISLEEINQRNYARYMAAKARKNRMQICKANKNNNSASKLPCI